MIAQEASTMSERNTSILQNVAARERTILKNVYLWMTAGLSLTALIAFFVASNPPLLRALVGNTMGFLLIVVGQFALVFYLSSRQIGRASCRERVYSGV